MKRFIICLCILLATPGCTLIDNLYNASSNAANYKKVTKQYEELQTQTASIQKKTVSGASAIKDSAVKIENEWLRTVVQGEAEVLIKMNGSVSDVNETKLINERIAMAQNGNMAGYTDALHKRLELAAIEYNKQQEAMMQLKAELVAANDKFNKMKEYKDAELDRKIKEVKEIGAQENTLFVCKWLSGLLALAAAACYVARMYIQSISIVTPVTLSVAAGLVLAYPHVTGLAIFPYVLGGVALVGIYFGYKSMIKVKDHLDTNEDEKLTIEEMTTAIHEYAKSSGLTPDEIQKHPLFTMLSRKMSGVSKDIIKEVKDKLNLKLDK